MARKYLYPPIIEALCEFRFDPTSSWDISIPGLIYEQLRDDYPDRQPRRLVEVALGSDVSSFTQQVGTADLIQFRHPQKPTLVQVGKHILTVNHLAPYSSWSDFLPLIERCFEIYCDITTPHAFHRIGLRYINQIDIEEDKFRLDLFSYRPFFGDKVSLNLRSFIIGAEIPFESGNDLLRFQLANAPMAKEGFKTTILDLDYFLLAPQFIGLKDAMQWVDQAHQHIETVFENSITNQLRKRFVESHSIQEVN